LVTTYQINTNDLDFNLINLIKSNFPNQELVIDVYPTESIDFEINEITNQNIIDRIKDINANKNILSPKINLV
jgi:hypothetical protein